MEVVGKILKLLKNNKNHFVEFKINDLDFTVYLKYDPEEKFEDKAIIPIRYDVICEFAYIPDEEYREKFKPDDFGIEHDEIKLIGKIMDLMEKYKEEIKDTCHKCSLLYRENNQEDER